MGSRRTVIALVVVAALAGSLGLGVDAYAVGRGDARGRGPIVPTSTPTSVGIGGGLVFYGATVTGPGLTRARHLNAYQAAAFVQSWFVDQFYGHVTRQTPPPTAAVYLVNVTGYWGGGIATLAVYYAAQGGRVWISFPRQPTAPTTPTTSPPAPSAWFVALPSVRKAFAGTAKLVPTAGLDQPTTTTTPAVPTTNGAAAAGPGASSGAHSSATPWVVAIVGLALAAGAGLWIRRSRGRTGSTS